MIDIELIPKTIRYWAQISVRNRNSASAIKDALVSVKTWLIKLKLNVCGGLFDSGNSLSTVLFSGVASRKRNVIPARDRGRHLDQEAKRHWEVCRFARTHRSACRRADTSNLRC